MRIGHLVAIVATMSMAGCGTRPSDNVSNDERPAAPPAHQPRPLTDVAFERTPERRARGRYLVEGPLQCFVCHSERDWTKPGAPPLADKVGAGAVWWNKPWLVAPNLTPDDETGIGRRTDDMLARAIREGISHDGRVLHQQMWYASFRRLADEDLASVIVYLRSLKPVRHSLPVTVIPKDVADDLDVPAPIGAPMAPPDATDPLARGRYLAALADCSGCHTSWYTPVNPGVFAGGNLIERQNVRAYSSNITSDASGLAHYDRALFREVMRTGRVRSRELSPVMPWVAFRHLSDADLDALFDYLMAFAPAKHVIDNVNPPKPCEICGGTHPLGEYNKRREFKAVPYSLADVRDFVGRYRFEDGFELTFTIEGGKFVGRAGEDPEPCALVTEDRRVFICPDEVERVEFVRAADGRVTGLRNNRVDPAVKIVK